MSLMEPQSLRMVLNMWPLSFSGQWKRTSGSEKVTVARAASFSKKKAGI